MTDRAPFRVIYPLNGGEPTAADRKRNKGLDPTNIWGERAYFFNCHRDGGDYSWHHDNLSTAPVAPVPEQISAVWTFGETWDPESKIGPKVLSADRQDGQIRLTFSAGHRQGQAAARPSERRIRSLHRGERHGDPCLRPTREGRSLRMEGCRPERWLHSRVGGRRDPATG